MLNQHRLEVNTGRWSKVKVERSQRFRAFCQNLGIRAIGDETHYVNHCPGFHNERMHLWNVVLRVLCSARRSLGYSDVPQVAEEFDWDTTKVLSLRAGLGRVSSDSLGCIARSVGRLF